MLHATQAGLQSTQWLGTVAQSSRASLMASHALSEEAVRSSTSTRTMCGWAHPSGCMRRRESTQPQTHHSRIVYAPYTTEKGQLKRALAGNATTHSSSDSSSPLGKLTSSSSSAFLLREEDMVVLGLRGCQLGGKAQSGGGKGRELMARRWFAAAEKREERDGKG